MIGLAATTESVLVDIACADAGPAVVRAEIEGRSPPSPSVDARPREPGALARAEIEPECYDRRTWMLAHASLARWRGGASRDRARAVTIAERGCSPTRGDHVEMAGVGICQPGRATTEGGGERPVACDLRERPVRRLRAQVTALMPAPMLHSGEIYRCSRRSGLAPGRLRCVKDMSSIVVCQRGVDHLDKCATAGW